MKMMISSRGIALVKAEELCKLTAYWDVDGYSIGWGHHGSDVKDGMQWTQDEADWALMHDLQWAVDAVNRLVKVPIGQSAFDALVDFVYNEGTGHFSTSHLLKKLNAGDYSGAAAEFPKWDLSRGELSEDLLRRRMREQAMFNGGISNA